MSRYNPCGRPVEIGRRPYRTHARLYADGPLVELVWYVARDDMPFLRGGSAINSLQWMEDRPDQYTPLSVGEDVNSDRVYSPERTKLTAISNHVCGTAADFRGDGLVNYTLPPVTYRPDGLPWCCGGILEGTGGLGLGGVALVMAGVVGTGGMVADGSAAVLPVVVGSGGLVNGGVADVLRAAVGSGGMAAEGTADVVAGSVRFGSGGVVAGGGADVVAGELVVGTGGVVSDGTADVVAGVLRVGTGGMVADGTADVYAGVLRVGTGGMVADGTADVVAAIAGSGGAVMGGVADVTAGGGGETCTDFAWVTPGSTSPLDFTLGAFDVHIDGAANSLYNLPSAVSTNVPGDDIVITLPDALPTSVRLAVYATDTPGDTVNGVDVRVWTNTGVDETFNTDGPTERTYSGGGPIEWVRVQAIGGAYFSTMNLLCFG